MGQDFLKKKKKMMDLLYAGDLVLCGESLSEIMDKYGRWKNAAEGKILRVNVDKTKNICI